MTEGLDTGDQRRRRSTATSNFGVGKREGHDASAFHARFVPPALVFAECVRKLEPGGRIAVNVADLGRKPCRSLSSDVIAIFEELGLLLRGEIIWQKDERAGGSCAWGSFQKPATPCCAT